MTLRGALPSLLSSAGGLALVAFVAASSPGCGDGNSVVCNTDGGCQVCDALGCRPASGGAGGSSSSSGASPTSSASSSSGANGGSSSHATGAGGASPDGGGDGAGGAAPAPCDPTQELCPCDDGTCPGGLSCVNGLCAAGCDFTYECGANKVCANGACVAACSAAAPCSAGFTCANGACEVDPFSPQCGSATPCPSGQACIDGVCTTDCTRSSQCATGQVCDGATHGCISDPSPVPVCSSNLPCPAGEECGTDGFCHYPCTSTSACQLIDTRFVACNDGVCKTEEEVDPQCTLEVPCPAGKTCVSNVCY